MVNIASKSYIQDLHPFGSVMIAGARRVLGPWLILWMLASDMNEDAHGI